MYGAWSKRTPEEDPSTRMTRCFALLAIVGLLLVGCTRVDAEDAIRKPDVSRSSVDRVLMDFGSEQASVFGGSPSLAATTIDQVRGQAQRDGWNVLGTGPAQGIHSMVLFLERDGKSLRVDLTKGIITASDSGECIRVTDEQANKLEWSDRAVAPVTTRSTGCVFRAPYDEAYFTAIAQSYGSTTNVHAATNL